MRLGIDAMGGDLAPTAAVHGALAARKLLGKDDRIVLVGRRDAILAELGESQDWQEQIEICHASQEVGMAEPPVIALRNKPDSSIAVLVEMHRDDKVDACISAGNTGAFVAASVKRLRRLAGVRRPGIAIVTPTYHGPVALCDVGANVNCRPKHLYHYGVMASIYVQSICDVDNPRVALLSIGQEDAKGNELVKKAREMFKHDRKMRFIGNVEGRDLFRGVCDVMVCEGFVGNVVLKLVEGMAEGVIMGMLGEMTATMPGNIDTIKIAAKAIRDKYDFNEYGGAPLLGVAGICIICHGASDLSGFKNAVRVAMEFSKHQVNEQITKRVGHTRRIVHG